MNNTFHTAIGIALLVFVVLPPVVGALRERGIDRRLRAAERGEARHGTVRRRPRAPASDKPARAAAPAPPQAARSCPAEA